MRTQAIIKVLATALAAGCVAGTHEAPRDVWPDGAQSLLEQAMRERDPGKGLLGKPLHLCRCRIEACQLAWGGDDNRKVVLRVLESASEHPLVADGGKIYAGYAPSEALQEHGVEQSLVPFRLGDERWVIVRHYAYFGMLRRSELLVLGPALWSPPR